ncbi:acetyl-hydrolase [Calycina marina]|uniref:Acetyl-hydrolase n=1 Tax=Calycina marina TaxID=1763456 RepID=A0A9P8CJ92_9HELO|nr:acetyl-hydrolase [Calycina marina]
MESSSPIPIMKAILPKVPLMGKTAISHTLGLSENAKVWDLRTALTINVLRSLIVDWAITPISKAQRTSLEAPEIKGRIWISKVTIPAPPTDRIRVSLFSAIESLKEPSDSPGGFLEPELLPVEAEWTGYRAGATKTSPQLRCSEEQKYKEMMKEVTSKTTVLYLHGGGYYLMDPATHRPTCKKLAKLTKGRCFSPRYRLAPQNPFPAALLDALVAYLTLLYPPPGSVHEPIEASNIVFAGDSAGGNLCLVLLQTVLELRRKDLKIEWYGEAIEVLAPAGIALSSPWCDLTSSSPSCSKNGGYDYLPLMGDGVKEAPQPQPCVAWPAKPPRKMFYSEDAMLCHPLVSPLSARSWEGSPPIYMGCGTELLADEAKCVAQFAARQGVPVVFEEYQAMPHCFAMILEALPASRLFFTRWSDFIMQVVEGKNQVESKATFIRAKTLVEEKMDVGSLMGFSEEEVRTKMRRSGVMSGKHPDALAKL